MRLLLDTHMLIWWWIESPRMSPRIRAMLADRSGDVFVSAASVWEMAIKHRLGKLPTAGGMLDRLDRLLGQFDFQPLAIEHVHARHAGALPNHHGDPFDRMLAAQAELEEMALVSTDRVFDRYNVNRIW